MVTMKGFFLILFYKSNKIFKPFIVHQPGYYIDEPPVDIDVYLNKYCSQEEGAVGGSGYEGQNVCKKYTYRFI